MHYQTESYVGSSITLSPFTSYWMAGFECTDKQNAFGHRVDFLNVTGHLDAIYEDYTALEQFNITTVREGIRWSFVEKHPYTYDFSIVRHMIKAGKACNIQQVWDLCHFGYPDDLSPLHPLFASRFAALCKAFAAFYRSIDPSSTLIIIPINEVSFISWLGGNACGTVPYCRGYGWEVKYMLMKAYIAGAAALKEVDNNIKILSSEPLVNMVPGDIFSEEHRAHAALQHQYQFQATDILCGYMCPELNGRPEYLDIMGVNYYYNNQWIAGTTNFLCWKNNVADSRWRPLHMLIEEVYTRYKKPLVITETSHPKEDRPLWMKNIAEQLIYIHEKNIPLLGVCLYPIIDRPDWDNLVTWHQSGLWDVTTENGNLVRHLNEPFAEAFLQAQELVDPFLPQEDQQLYLSSM